MKKILIFALLTTSFAAFTQEQDEVENLYREETFEQEMFMMKQEQEELPAGTAEISEEQLAEEEVYDSEVDYND